MTDRPSPERSDAPLKPAEPVRKPAARAVRTGLPLIWLVPIAALVVTLGVGWNMIAGRGTLISVAFKDATGITPGETALKFREITVGKVESVRFTEDLQQVLVNMRVDKDLAPYIDSESQFWIVRPQVSAQGISRLDTVLTGAFVEGFWDDKPDEPQTRFQGLDRPPLTSFGEKGTWIVLSTDRSRGMTEGAPVMFRGLPVGQMQNLRLSEDDESVLADVFIAAPHDARLTTSTVFWDTSGFSVSLGAQGLSLNVNSLASVLQGGAEFATLTSGGRPVEDGHVFTLQPDEATARTNLFADEAQALRLTMRIGESVKGLETGANVQFMGLTVGRVTDLAARVIADAEGREHIEQEVTLALTPARLGLPDETTPEQALDFLAGQVRAGLRARVASAGFFGTSLQVELVELPDATPAELDRAGDPYPLIPSVPGEISDFTETAQGFLTRVGNLPIEEALKSVTDMMNSVTAIASSEDTRAIPGALRGTLEDAQAAAGEIRQVTTELRESGAVGQLRRMVDEAAAAAEAVKLAAADVPAMVDQIDAAAVKIEAVDYAAIGTEAEGILRDVRALLGTEDAERLPRDLSETLKAASGLLNDLRDGNAAGSLNTALASASTAAQDVSDAAKRLPQLSARLEALAARADAVIAAYGDRSSFNNETINLMREMRRAANAFGSLARTIERNPQAFILGR
ncbi:intermembrane transport protein PqiB [Paracoccus sp. P2]|uniref:MCE family protein n=1 Tax=Paracoccus pantotrophus TaxID=82367 RepID=A0A1I5BDA9_PARPN|nr:MlaD family protein [Paracoccus pantotrophus]MDF3852765.1 MlaD family protein [Paracoccus pantotrophus]QFG36714.1 MCE family protein [Paracoccus pantotrophus]QLH14277.1 MCE family protein [Paracoccus pantotrophus]RKS52888.1 paraquat-inducible protein B [Paracoccus pantotrophus]RNI18489.1 MCE family protein [Paracoccus pantotrophus]